MSQACNPRFLAYCAAHGRGPEDMLIHDDRRFPGGVMAGFIVWIGEQWSAWERATGRIKPHSPQDQDAFDVWLRQ